MKSVNFPKTRFEKKKTALVRAGESKSQEPLLPDSLFETLRTNAGAIFDKIAAAQARAQ
jgi:hypothetical protein